jgi:hypothetical protein
MRRCTAVRSACVAAAETANNTQISITSYTINLAKTKLCFSKTEKSLILDRLVIFGLNQLGPVLPLCKKGVV